MSTEEIQLNEKLIAEFMDYDMPNGNSKDWNKALFEAKKWYIEHRYYKSWDWLMPVVEKMEEMGFGADITPHDVTIIDYVTGNEDIRVVIQNDDNYPKIYLVYLAVIEFIKWYNQNLTK